MSAAFCIKTIEVYFFCSFAQASFKVTVLLKTRRLISIFFIKCKISFA